MSRLAKNIRFPDISKVKDLVLREVLQRLFDELQIIHHCIHNDLNRVETGYFIKDGVEWRLIPVGEDFELQKKVSGVWQEGKIVWHGS